MTCKVVAGWNSAIKTLWGVYLGFLLSFSLCLFILFVVFLFYWMDISACMELLTRRIVCSFNVKNFIVLTYSST